MQYVMTRQANGKWTICVMGHPELSATGSTQKTALQKLMRSHKSYLEMFGVSCDDEAIDNVDLSQDSNEQSGKFVLLPTLQYHESGDALDRRKIRDELLVTFQFKESGYYYTKEFFLHMIEQGKTIEAIENKSEKLITDKVAMQVAEYVIKKLFDNNRDIQAIFDELIIEADEKVSHIVDQQDLSGFATADWRVSGLFGSAVTEIKVKFLLFSWMEVKRVLENVRRKCSEQTAQDFSENGRVDLDTDEEIEDVKFPELNE